VGELRVKEGEQWWYDSVTKRKTWDDPTAAPAPAPAPAPTQVEEAECAVSKAELLEAMRVARVKRMIAEAAADKAAAELLEELKADEQGKPATTKTKKGKQTVPAPAPAPTPAAAESSSSSSSDDDDDDELLLLAKQQGSRSAPAPRARARKARPTEAAATALRARAADPVLAFALALRGWIASRGGRIMATDLAEFYTSPAARGLAVPSGRSSGDRALKRLKPVAAAAGLRIAENGPRIVISCVGASQSPPETAAAPDLAAAENDVAATSAGRIRRDYADAPRHSIGDLLKLEPNAGSLAEEALRKLGAFASRPVRSSVFVSNVRVLGDVRRVFDDPRVGSVVRVRRNGVARHCCYVDYAHAASAASAVERFDKRIVDGRALSVATDAPDEEKASDVNGSGGPASLLPLLGVDAAPVTLEDADAYALDGPLAALLARLDLTHISPALVAEEIDLEALPLLNIHDLVGIGLKPEDAEKLLVAAAEPVAPAAPPPPPPTVMPRTQECPLCMDGDREIALVPCGHVLCAACAGQHASESCPMCRQGVASTMRVYF